MQAKESARSNMGTVIALTGVLVPLIVIAAILFFVFRGENALIAKGRERMAELKQRIARATPAQATVSSSRTLTTFEGGAMAFVELRLDVRPSSGAAYAATTEWELNTSSLSQVEPGRPVGVKIDAEDPGLIYPDVTWATFSRAYAARRLTGEPKR
ncbi:hypothetical protein WMF20_20280 [Sorangium sp. So ce834]|uniref:hypothetical protein n=1 Tax=Sorangium sp. So ce834 TaxID=3133321 RepID=UPI003F627987